MFNIDSVIDQQIEFGLTEELEVTISIPKDMQDSVSDTMYG